MVLNRAPTHGASLDVPATQDVLRRFEHVKGSGLVVRERAAIRRATPYGMLVDEYGASDKNATNELGEVCRLVYGMHAAWDVEIQEGRCQCAQRRARCGHEAQAGLSRSAVQDERSMPTPHPTGGTSWTLRTNSTGG